MEWLMETGWLLVEEFDRVVDGTGRWSGTTIVAIIKSRW